MGVVVDGEADVAFELGEVGEAARWLLKEQRTWSGSGTLAFDPMRTLTALAFGSRYGGEKFDCSYAGKAKSGVVLDIVT